MATKSEIARQYLDLQRKMKFDDVLELVADDVAVTTPGAGTVSGKAAAGKQMKERAARGGGSAEIQWGDPEEDGNTVQVIGTGSPFGPVKIVFEFAPDEKIAKVDVGLASGSRDAGSLGQQAFQPPPLDFRWASVPTERPPRLGDLGPDGFTLKMADAGSYAWAPDHWPYENDTPRGAWPAKPHNRGLPAPYTIYNKHEVWAENCADLYELAIRERWIPATGVAWGSIEALPEHVEASIDQICTLISEQQYNSNQVLMGWLKDISYGYHEVKLYLATQVYDQARHVEAFRKRALANGGGLGVQTPGFMNRTVYGAFKFTELVCYVNILRASFLLGLADFADRIGRSQADRQLFEGMANDLHRHMAYGAEHLKFYIRANPEHYERAHVWLNRGEAMLAADLRRDTVQREAFILALGDTVQKGKEGLKELRQAQLQKYLRTLEAAGVADRESRLIPAFRDAIENP
ncbi:MAG: nuclear transport factor 2 family protein [Dehalococcoidia bacterium]